MSGKICIDRLGRKDEAWALVPGGPFKMGSEGGDADYDEGPVRQVRLDAYCAAKYEITNADWARYKKATFKFPGTFELIHTDCTSQGNETVVDTRATREELASSPANFANYKTVCGVRSREVLPPVQDEGSPSQRSKAPNQPKTRINRQDAREYCQWLGGDLMTEAQWEKAARGGRDLEYATADGKKPTKMTANYDLSFGGPLAVGSFSANPFGLHDMSGNVMEWVLDNYDKFAYHYLSTENPVNLHETCKGVLRGGSWAGGGTDHHRAASRVHWEPADRFFLLGARCALPPQD